MLTDAQKKVLETLSDNTHSLFTTRFLSEVNTAFNVNILPISYIADGHKDPKGLTLNDNARSAEGIAAFDLAPMLCRALEIKYESFMGRGFQVRACVKAISKAMDN